LIGAVLVALPLPILAVYLGWFVVITLPLRIAANSVRLTEEYEGQRRYVELAFTAEPTRDLLQSYVAEFTNRWALWLMIVVLLTPWLAFATPRAAYDYGRLVADCTSTRETGTCLTLSILPSTTETAQEVMIYAAALIGLLGASLLAVVIGVKLSLTLSGYPVLIVWFFMLATVVIILVTTVFGFADPVGAEPITITLVRGDMAALMPYIVGLVLMHLPMQTRGAAH
jgi:hypothetical protein